MATTDADRDTGNGAGGNGSGAGKVRQTASEAYEAARQRTVALYGSAREGASRAGHQAVEQIDANPLAAVVGGLAIGAVIAALLPRTERENEAFGAIGGRINDTALDAARAARDAGRDKLDELGLSREGARQRFQEIASTAGDALRTSASAAARSVRGKDDEQD
jgi:ElaB/YqjD/DUF883 family membrane-anchored ribosome-binding protein